MHFVSYYTSPVGEILLAADTDCVAGLWFEGEKYYARCLDKEHRTRETPVLCLLKKWLDIYFSGREPDIPLPLRLHGTPFQQEVWRLLQEIPYGSTTTYGTLAASIARRHGIPRMSAQAVGSAVGKNNINLVIPCHRVIAADNGLCGYAGGLERKKYFLQLEHALLSL